MDGRVQVDRQIQIGLPQSKQEEANSPIIYLFALHSLRPRRPGQKLAKGAVAFLCLARLAPRKDGDMTRSSIGILVSRAVGTKF